jgi:hypothetical protein
MKTTRLRSLAAAVLVAAFALVGAGCIVEEDVGPPAYAEGYEPVYYDGHVIYYDDLGRPYYFTEGAIVWVPATSPVYVRLVNHWRFYGPAYHRWYAHYGYRYHGYHGGPHRYR